MTTIRNPRGQAREAATRIETATVAISAAVDAQEEAFHAIEDAILAARTAGFDYTPDLTAELRAAHARWLDRPDNADTISASDDPLDRIPDFLR